MGKEHMKTIKFPLTAFVASTLIACGGGGGGSSSGSTSSSSDVLVGKFVDAPTAGVSYTCGSQSGKTDSNGNFNYQSGQSCT